MALKNVMRGAARAVLPLMVAACSVGMMGMTPADGPDAPLQTQTLKKQEAQTRIVDESYQLKKLVVRYDEGSGNFDMQLRGFDDGAHTGTGKPTQMFLGFRAIRGKGPNATSGSSVVKVNTFKFQYDPNNNDGSLNMATVDVTLEPDHYGSNKSIFTIVPADDPNADPELSGAFEVKSQKYSATLPVEFTDMRGKRLLNVKQAARDIMQTTTLGMAVVFNQNNFYRSVALGSGQERGNYFPEKMYLTGAQYSND